jgi:hypothetical protein
MLTTHKGTTGLQTTTRLKSHATTGELLEKPLSKFQPTRLGTASSSHSSLKAKSKRPNNRAVPGGRVFTYSISTVGTTYSGNTSFPASNTSYTPAANFRLPGALVIEPTIFAQNSNRRNGVNAREITFIIGNDTSLITAGTLRYSTHTWGHRHWGGRTTGRPQVDTAFVNINNRTNTATASVDQQWARNDTSNLFSWKSSLINAPKQILAGDMRIRFTNGGRNVSGSVRFFGNGFIEPGAYAYTASFTGSLFR